MFLALLDLDGGDRSAFFVVNTRVGHDTEVNQESGRATTKSRSAQVKSNLVVFLIYSPIFAFLYLLPDPL